jgi:hypothetical protein
MKALNRMPTYQEPLNTKGQTTRGWYQFFTGLLQGQPTQAVQVVTLGPSPYSFVAPVGGTLILNAGSTTGVAFSRDGNNYYQTNQTVGMFPVSQGDILLISYPMAPPTAAFAPR